MKILSTQATPTIKSKQSGTANISGSSANIAISEVKKSKSIAKVNYRTSSSGTARGGGVMPSIQLLSDILINISVGINDTVYAMCAFEVTEYNNVKNKQEGSVPVVGTGTVGQYKDINVSNIDLQKYELYCSFRTTDSVTDKIYSVAPKYYMLDENTIRVEIGYLATSTTLTIEWQLLEFR